jgi:hypothetical protein
VDAALHSAEELSGSFVVSHRRDGLRLPVQDDGFARPEQTLLGVTLRVAGECRAVILEYLFHVCDHNRRAAGDAAMAVHCYSRHLAARRWQ